MGYSPWGRKDLDTTQQLSRTQHGMPYRLKALISAIYWVSENKDLQSKESTEGRDCALVARWKFLALSQVGILTSCPSTELAKEEKSPARLCLLDQGEHPRGEGGTLKCCISGGAHMADPWGREGSDRAKLPVELGPHLQSGAWQSQGTGTQGQGSSLLAPSLSQDQRSELGIVKAHWVVCLFVFAYFWFISPWFQSKLPLEHSSLPQRC